MSLLKDRIFWKTKLPVYTRLCYLTGFIGYVYTAVFTFVAPALAIGMMLFVPGSLLLRNLIFVAPVLFYAGVIYPMWHHAPYRLEAWSVRVISGWVDDVGVPHPDHVGRPGPGEHVVDVPPGRHELGRGGLGGSPGVPVAVHLVAEADRDGEVQRPNGLAKRVR